MNTYEKLSSKVKRIIIPLPDFKFFHRTSCSTDSDDRFVGRRNIIDKLKNWLDVPSGATGKDFTGSYLITGYRGMGKTSFVSRVIDELCEKETNFIWPFRGVGWQRKFWAAVFTMLPFFITLAILAIFWNSDWESFKNGAWIWLVCWWLLCAAFIIFLLFHVAPKFRRHFRSILRVKVNIGNEVGNIRDVLSLLAYSIRDRITEHINQVYIFSPTNLAIRAFKFLFISIFFILVSVFSIKILELGSAGYFNDQQDTFVYYLIKYINDVSYSVRTESSHIILTFFAGGILAYGISYGLWRLFKKWILHITSYWKNRRYALPDHYLGMIDELCNRIDSSVSEDNSPYGDVSIASYISIKLRRKKSREYKVATVREIEHELIEFIKEINCSKLLHCRFIVILDELDKLCLPSTGPVDSHLTSNGGQIDSDRTTLPEFSNDDNGMSDEMSSNEKRHRILAFLSQLKYFVSTAEAKFVFIAGHELHDAYKADVSDREFSISSVFNGVINVNSFFSYDSRIKDVTRMTETFLCRQLFGDEEKVDTARKERNTFRLAEYSDRITIENDMDGKERQTVLCFLKQFVTYLTFVSNGAPKKLNARLERYVISSEKFKREHAGSSGCIVVKLKEGRNEDDVKYYLSFGYHDQQKIGFVHYMAAPIFENIISPSSDYGDKFLVSSSFLIAHIYKHHKSGFSWRNLEYLPDLIDNNRTPELREFINSVIDYLGKVHLTNITSGIFAYKFPMKLAEEIAIFTKKSDELSAIFNFSLDYFSAVKKYYYRLIDFYSKHEKELHMTAAIHHNLGDIHMANDEYSEAIIQYRCAASDIERDIAKFDGVSGKAGELASCIVRYIRIMMKLGHAYEKRNTIDSAHLIYTVICSKLVAYREIDEESLGLKYYYINTRESCRGKRDSVIFTNADNNMHLGSNEVFSKQCYPNVIDKSDTQDWKFWIKGSEIVNNLSEYLTPQKHSLITKLSVFEDLRMAYMPILSKLWALEKYNICGITDDNLKLAESEFQYMYIITNSKDKNLLRIDFFRKLGDILYYKNKSGKKEVSSDSLMDMINSWGYDYNSTIFNYCYRKRMPKCQISLYVECFNVYDLWKSECRNQKEAVDNLISIYESEREERADKLKGTSDRTINLHCADEARGHFINMFDVMPEGFAGDFQKLAECSINRKGLSSSPCQACRCYKRSLRYLRDHMISKKFPYMTSDSLVFLYALENKLLLSYRFNELIQAALTLEAMGNVMLCCSKVGDGQVSIDPELLRQMFESFEKEHDENSGIYHYCNKYIARGMTHFEKSILYYWTAMRYYTKAGNHKESIQALIRIFNVLSSYHATSFRKNKVDVTVIDAAAWPSVEHILQRQIADIAKVRMCDNVSESVRLKRILNLRNLSMELTSIMPEIEELLVSYYELKLSQTKDFDQKCSLMTMLYNSSSLRYLRNDSMIYNRVISLMLKARLNEKAFELLGLSFKEDSDSLSMFAGVSDCAVETVSELLGVGDTYDKDDLLAFLIVDSMFCLLNVAGALQSNVKTTLFSNSFCYGVYDRLYYWVRWQNRIPPESSLYNAFVELRDKILEGHHKLLLTPEYMRGMARRCVEAAYSMHSEGSEYQNFIRNLYILDDDLQNNTCQFYFALERMKINSDFFKYDYRSEECFFSSFAPDMFYQNKVGRTS